MKKLKTIIKEELRAGETIFITTQKRLNDIYNREWWKMDEYTIDQIYNVYSGEEKVNKVWHEEGLCIILK